MIEANGGGHEFVCDVCGESLETETIGFREALNEAKDLGWHFSRDRWLWLAKCPGCSEEEEE